MKEIICNSWEEFDDLMVEYDLEDCGMSGDHPSYHWFCDDNADVSVYVK